MSRLLKACEHSFFDPHRFTVDGLVIFGWSATEVCPGGTEPTTEELVEELNRRRASAAPYDIEIPDFVNRHGTW